jgi:hypothetical protein
MVIRKEINFKIRENKMSKLTHHIECSKFNTWIVRDLNKQLVYIGISRSDAIKWAFNQNKENRKGDKNG